MTTDTFPPELVALCEQYLAANERYIAILGISANDSAQSRIVYDMQAESALDDLMDAKRAYERELKLHMAAKQFMRLPADEVAS